MCNYVQQNNIEISFCIPVYNVENYLKDCIISIASNSIGLKYEIICIDDASTDNSFSLLQSIRKNVPQMKIYQNKTNRGVGYTRNRLITLASGSYIWFVDPDDMLYPGAASSMLNAIMKNNVNVILGNYIRCSEEDTYTNFQLCNSAPRFTCVSIYDNDFLPNDDQGYQMNAIWSCIFNKNFLTENQLLFQENMIAQEDTLFYYKMSLKLQSAIKYSNPCYIYRQRQSSVMHFRSPERSKRYYHSMRTMYEEYTKHYITGDYNNKTILLEKIHHTVQNITTSLAGIPNTKYVKKELNDLKAMGIYPYKFRKDALKTNESLYRRILFFLQPIELFFWILHSIYKLKFKRSSQ